MNISALGCVNTVNIRNTEPKTRENTDKTVIEKQKQYPAYMPGYGFISFCGGKSLDLGETKKQLDKYSVYPPDIKEDIEKTLAEGNPGKKTLIDIHKDKYALLNECETLKEAKELYPEFKDVLSDTQVSYKANSFMDEAKQGRIRGFDPDTDIALQLLQLYWGEGFSLTTLKEDYAGKNIHGVFEKLNIPRVDSLYGNYLKLSDPDYNQRYTKTISERAENIERTRREKEDGVYIPGGPLTEEHKKHISEGLKKYYSENPDRIFEMSERVSKYYEENPEEKEKLSIVLERAWGYREAKSVRKKMAKFMKKSDIDNEDIKKSLDKNESQNKTFKEFWQRNTWAKNIFSECLKKSWQKQAELEKFGLRKEPVFVSHMIPTGIVQKIREYTKIEDIDKYLYAPVISDEDISTPEYKKYVNSEKYKNTSNAITQFWQENPDVADMQADTMMTAFEKTMSDLKKLCKKTSDPEKTKYYKELICFIFGNVEKLAQNNNVILSEDLQNIYSLIINFCLMNNDKAVPTLIDKNIEEVYQKIKNMNDQELKEYRIGIIENLYNTEENKPK